MLKVSPFGHLFTIVLEGLQNLIFRVASGSSICTFSGRWRPEAHKPYIWAQKGFRSHFGLKLLKVSPFELLFMMVSEGLQNLILGGYLGPKRLLEPLWPKIAQSEPFWTTFHDGFGRPSEFDF